MAQSPRNLSLSPKLLLVAGSMLAIGVGGLVTAGALAASGSSSDNSAQLERCALPSWISELPTSQSTADRLARYAVLCNEMNSGRMDIDDYRQRVDALWAEPKIVTGVGVAPIDPVQWASGVVSFSSQYSTSSWSAQQVLGPPNVGSSGSDSAQAWATEDQDRGQESIVLSYSRPQRVRSVEIYETYNPGAVTRVELLDSDGRVVGEHSRPAGYDYNSLRTITFGCTDVAVESVRIVMDTTKVSGWNEIDAVGLHPCL